jgi:hypothetical protein
MSAYDMGMGTWNFGILLHSTICQTKATLIFDVRCGPIVVFERFCAERSQESGVASQVKYNTREVVVYGHRQTQNKSQPFCFEVLVLVLVSVIR